MWLHVNSYIPCRLRGSARCHVASPPAETEAVFQETTASPEQLSEAVALPYYVPMPKRTVIVRGELSGDPAKSSGITPPVIDNRVACVPFMEAPARLL